MNHRHTFTLAVLVCIIAGCVPTLSGLDGALDAHTDATADGGDARDGTGDVACFLGQTRCSGTCVDTTSSSANCGGCGMACPTGQTCTMGHCGLTCPTGMTECGSGTLARCVNTSSDGNNCGACNHMCTGGAACELGGCLCPAGQAVCAGACVDLQSDNNNCAMCGNVCPAGTTCTGLSGCCNSTEMTCFSGVWAETSCTFSLMTDTQNCGACGNVCPQGQSCSSGVCSCVAPSTMCGVACVNLQGDGNNCGGCGISCSGGSCSAGVCSCPTTSCNGSCTDTTRNINNCGSCGHRCPAGAGCNSSACTCPAGTILCGSICSNTLTDASNCGTCGTSCSATQRCQAGSCIAAPSGHYAMGVSSSTFTDVCSMTGAMNILSGIDDGVSGPIQSPFPFLFYGLPYNAVRPSADGYVLVGPGGSQTDGQYSVFGPLPDPMRAAPAIYAIGVDLVQRAGPNTGVCVATLGTAPNRHFVIETSDAFVYYYGSYLDMSSHLTFEVVINEADNSIDLLYSSVFWGLVAVPVDVGLQDALAQRATSIQDGNTPLTTVTSGTAIHLSYVP